MTKHQYESCLNFFKNHSTYQKALLFLANLCPLITFISYAILLISMFLKKNPALLQCILIPAACFISTTILRKLCHCQRPFEIYKLTPLKAHDLGESFPSRHSASAMIIALTVCQSHFLWGSLLLLNTFIIGLTRILMALHFPKDVFGGYFLALLFSIIYLL